MQISLIAAIARNNAIGFQNKLLYWLPNDLRHFKSLTTGKTIIMGRKTFDSLPNGALPNRRNIVLTRQPLSINGTDVFPTLHAALHDCRQHFESDEPFAREVVVIGGASLYRQTLALADTLYITLVDDIPIEADAFFPEIDVREWQEVGREDYEPDERHPFAYSFVCYKRVKQEK